MVLVPFSVTMAANGNAPAHGVMVAPLKEAYAGRIVVGDRTFFLRDGATCSYPAGTQLEVVYTELDGRRDVERITPAQHGR